MNEYVKEPNGELVVKFDTAFDPLLGVFTLSAMLCNEMRLARVGENVPVLIVRPFEIPPAPKETEKEARQLRWIGSNQR